MVAKDSYTLFSTHLLIGSTGLVYLPPSAIRIKQHVGTYTIHGSYKLYRNDLIGQYCLNQNVLVCLLWSKSTKQHGVSEYKQNGTENPIS